MEFLKKYWWLILLAPVVVYFIYKFYEAKKKVNEGAARAREAKANKAIIEAAIQEEKISTANASDN